MMRTTKIEWTERTWNPVTGCSKQSEGCTFCYAEAMAKRLKAMGNNKYTNGFSVTLHYDLLNKPLLWKKNATIFVCSMSDLFHEEVPFDFIDMVMNTIVQCPQHTFQILTKRPQRMSDYFSTRDVPQNVWVGTTIESPSVIHRMEILTSIKANVRFISCEPLLADLGEIDLTGINWIIVGGESGPHARPMKPEWAENILNLAIKYNIPFFFKQWGTWGSDGQRGSKKRNGKLIKGRIIQQMPII